MTGETAPTREVVELRVHGVGGTKPEAILDDPHLRRVSGDDLVGFYRPAVQESPLHIREALSWGKITAGDAARALWVLLLPFALANLAGWTHPAAPGATGFNARTRERTVKLMARLFSLSVTVGATLMSANIFMDVIAYQCGAIAACRESRWWLAIFGRGFLADRPAARLAVGALLCFMTLMFLLWISRASYKNFEEFDQEKPGRPDPVETGPEGPPDDVGLQDQNFWRGAGPVGQVRDLHAAAALATISLVLAYSTGVLAVSGAWGGWNGFLAGLSCLILLVSALGVSIDAEVYRRRGVPRPDRYRSLKLAAHALLGLSIISALTIRSTAALDSSRLTTLDVFTYAWVAFQGALLLTLFVYQWKNRKQAPPKAPFAGVTTFAVCALALFTISSMWAGGLIRLADLLGIPSVDGIRGIGLPCTGRTAPPARPGAEPEAIICYAQYHQKTAIVALVVFAALIVVGIRVWWWLKKQSRECRPDALADLRTSGWEPPDPIPAATERRIDQVARSYSLSTLVANADSLLLRVVLLGSAVALVQHFQSLFPNGDELLRQLSAWPWSIVALVVLVAAMVIPVGEQPSGRAGAGDHAPRRNIYWVFVLAIAEAVLSLSFVRHSVLVNGASWAVTLLPVALAAGLYGGLRNPNLRRSIGIAWDVITFWPRHNHPFAPPCYGERLVPQLRYRIENLTDPGKGDCGRVLLSAHSQGSVVAAAALLQIDPQAARRTALFTYGSPLEILFARLFPAYFGNGILAGLEQKLIPGNIPVPWRHFYCRTDPLGVPMTELTGAAPSPAPATDIEAAPPPPKTNTHLLDPHTWEAVRGEPPWPLRRHSAYLEHPHFLANVDETVAELAAAMKDCP